MLLEGASEGSDGRDWACFERWALRLIEPLPLCVRAQARRVIFKHAYVGYYSVTTVLDGTK